MSLITSIRGLIPPLLPMSLQVGFQGLVPFGILGYRVQGLGFSLGLGHSDLWGLF